MSTIWRNIDKVTGLPFEHLWRVLGGAVAAALALGGGLVAPQAMAISTSLLLAVVLLSALCLGLHYSFCSCTPPRYKTCTRLNFRSKSLANIELAHRATSSGGRGQRFESSRARHSKPIKSILPEIHKILDAQNHSRKAMHKTYTKIHKTVSVHLTS